MRWRKHRSWSVTREPKAARQRRTPKRKRESGAEIAATFWSAAVFRRFLWIDNTDGHKPV
jgi:hypothetical protein